MGGYSDDVLFIHIPKCGGYAAKFWLREHVPGFKVPVDDLGRRTGELDFPIGHIPLRDIERFSGRHPSSWAKVIATVRNPYDQQLSQWMFWRDRYAKGGRHVHDRYAAGCKNLDEFLSSPECDFHVWYEQHHGTGHEKALGGTTGERYPDYGGYYRYWLEVDGEVPDYVEIVKLENLDEGLRDAVREFADPPLPRVPRKNSGPGKSAPTINYYTPASAREVERKFAWCFEVGLYEAWKFSDLVEVA